MRPRGIIAGWAALALAFALLLGWELAHWRALATEGRRAAAERVRLTEEIRLREQQLVSEMRAHAALLQDMQWTASGGDPAAFLTRLAELVREKRMTVTAIGPLERQATPQFSKSWHTIQVVAPYREIRELAMRVEGDKGILEDVRLEPAPAPAGRAAAAPGPEEVQARFRLVALDLSPAARKVLDRALAASGPGAGPPPPGVPGLARAAAPDPISRDPFAFAIPKVASRPGSPALRPDKPPAPMELTAIVGFPGGFLAIVNNQIVKTGDVVNGHRVEKITDRLVSLREPGGLARTLELPELGAAPAAPRR